jgi:hypothetical protein
MRVQAAMLVRGREGKTDARNLAVENQLRIMRSVGDVFVKTNRVKAVGLEVFLFAFDFSNQ